MRLRSFSAISASSAAIPIRTSTTKRTKSASSIACSDCLLTLLSSAVAWLVLGSQPPVSTRVNSFPAHSISKSLRSRVTPGRSSTMAFLLPISLLTRVDFPTLGRPTTATTGFLGIVLLQCLAKGNAICCNDFNFSREVFRRHAIEKFSLRKTNIWDEIPVFRWFL